MFSFTGDDANENDFPDNQTVLGKISPFASASKQFMDSPLPVRNDAARRRGSSRHLNPLEYSVDSDDVVSEDEGVGGDSLIMQSTSTEWREPVWTEDPPFQLVRSTKDEFEITPEGYKYFAETIADRKIIVLTVCGLYRTGKSYLLNLLSGRIGPSASSASHQSLFATSGTVSACTSGIWVWGSSLSAADQPVYILVDCEGSGNTSNSRDRDARLFAIAMLMSSFFLYNSRGVIDEHSLSNLSLVTSLAASVQSTALAQRSKPRFMWVLRDFVLALEDLRGSEISSSEYLDQCLRGKPYRSNLLRMFSSLDCSTLVTPVLDESKLQLLVDQGWTGLRAEFRAQISSLRDKLFRDAKPKRSCVDESEMTASEFIKFIQSAVAAINSNELPKIDTIWKQVRDSELENLLGELRSFFDEKADAIHLPCDEADLGETLNVVRKETLKKFRSTDADARNELVFHIHTKIKSLESTNDAKTKERAELLLRQLWRDEVVGPLRQTPSAALVEERIGALKSRFFSQVIGNQQVALRVFNDNILPRAEKLRVDLSNNKEPATSSTYSQRANDPYARGIPIPRRTDRCRCVLM